MNVTFEQVRDIVADAISCDLEQVKPETNLYDDLEIDSLDAVELSMALQEALGVGIADEDIANIKTVEDIVTYLSGKQE